MTVSEVRGYGRQRGKTEIYRGAEYNIDFLPKIKIEIAIEDSTADKAVEFISETCNSGRIGDGKIFVMRLKTQPAFALVKTASLRSSPPPNITQEIQEYPPCFPN